MNDDEVENDNDDSSTTTDEIEASSSGLLQLVDAISKLPRHANERSDIVTNASGAVFDAVVVVDRVSSSVGTVNSDPRYEYGKSITGTIQGTNQAIQVITPEALNDDIDELRRGDIWPVLVSLLNWDNLYNRINARQADENA